MPTKHHSKYMIKNDVLKLKILETLLGFENITLNDFKKELNIKKDVNERTLKRAIYFLEVLGLVETYVQKHGLRNYRYIKYTDLGMDIFNHHYMKKGIELTWFSFRR